MTNLILGFAIAASSLVACNNNKGANTKQTEVKNDAPVASAVQKATDTTVTAATVAFPAKEIIAGYLQLKNALAKDNGTALTPLLWHACANWTPTGATAWSQGC